MNRHLLTLLRCPGCRSPYDALAHVERDERIELGYLRCHCRSHVIPILDGFVCFTEPLLHAGLAGPEALAALAMSLFGSAEDFARAVANKLERRVLEMYAAFQPFNESTRAVEPLLPRLRAGLHPGDAVLDVWCRTGWSGEWLAGEMPAQHVVALWKGNSSVLGYRGFRHLLATGDRAANLDVVFADCAMPLPFADGAFGLLYGHDALHRLPPYPFVPECLRVTRADGALVFPHVHLANSEPDPYFERGGHIRHGRDYRALFDALPPSERRGLILSEEHLFSQSVAGVQSLDAIADDYDTPHYNGLVALLPPAEPQTEARDQPDEPDLRYVLSPLFRFDLARGRARVAGTGLETGRGGGGSGGLDAEVDALLPRHPIYRARLPAADIGLDDLSLGLMVAAAAGLERAQLLCVAEPSAAHAALDGLCAAEMLRPARVSAAVHRLQRYHSNQRLLNAAPLLGKLLSNQVDAQAPRVFAADGQVFSAEDMAEILYRVPQALHSLGVAPGGGVTIEPHGQPMLLHIAVAAALSGYRVRLQTAATPHAGAGADSELHLTATDLALDSADVDAPCAGVLQVARRASFMTALQAIDVRPTPEFAGDGVIALTIEAGDGGLSAHLDMTVGTWLHGIAALLGQWEGRLYVADGVSTFRDLSNACAALLTGGILHHVA